MATQAECHWPDFVYQGHNTSCSPDPCNRVEPCPGDVTGDGSVGVADLLQLLACWGEVGPGNGGASECESADLTGGGSVGVADLLQLLANWGPCPR